MTKAELTALEKVYAAEVDGALLGMPGLFQSKAKIYKALEREGLVRWKEEIIPADKSCPWPITVSGWELTIAGNLAYCMSCP